VDLSLSEDQRAVRSAVREWVDAVVFSLIEDDLAASPDRKGTP